MTPNEGEGGGLKLEARDADDLAVVAAVLQDAVTRLGEMSYSDRAHRFAAMFNRFRWEGESAGAVAARALGRARHQRVRAGIHFDGILSARISGLDQADPEQVLELLTITCEPRKGGAATITLVFAGTGLVRLEAECIDCRLSDLGAPWPTPRKPSHDDPGDA